jgi:hypothetical protein
MRVFVKAEPAGISEREVEIHLRICSATSAPNTRMEITLSPAIELVSGQLIWSGVVEPKESREFVIRIRVPQRGRFPLAIYAFHSWEGDEFGFGAGETIYLISPESAGPIAFEYKGGKPSLIDRIYDLIYRIESC